MDVKKAAVICRRLNAVAKEVNTDVQVGMEQRECHMTWLG